MIDDSFLVRKKTGSVVTLILPLRFRNAGRVWRGGPPKTHRAACHNRVTPSKTKECFKSSCLFNYE